MSRARSPAEENRSSHDQMIISSPIEGLEKFDGISYGPPTLSFISQTGPKIQDPAVKKLVRQNARNHASREKGKHVDSKPLQFRLLLPESFSFAPSLHPETTLEGTSLRTEVPENDVMGSDGVQNYSWGLMSDPNSATSKSFSAQEEILLQNGFGHEQGVFGSHMGAKHDELSTRQPISRNRKPKVRTGCLTCKTRHIKCDESKPSCLRCLKSIGTCVGYANPKPTVTRYSPRSIVPRPSSLRQQPTATVLFNDNTESYFFTIFQTETASDLSGVFKSTFWNRILLQESSHQNFVRHAIIGIAALNQSAKSSHLAQFATGSSKEVWQAEATKQKKYALEQYDKSIKGMRTIQTTSDAYFRKVLISTLLVFVFETIHVQPDSAFWHALIGDRMLCHWASEQWSRQDSGRRGIASPASSILEDDILLTFCRFDTQMLSFVDTRGRQTHINGMREGSVALQQMPMIFSDLAEATTYWELVLRRSCHFIMYGAVQTDSKRLQKGFSSTLAGRSIEFDAENSIYGSPFVIPNEFIEEHLEHIGDISRWSASFHNLLDQRGNASSDLREVTNIALLRLTSLSTKIAVSGMVFTNETSYDVFLPEFSEIVSLARAISENLLAISNNSPAYHFHTSIVPPLFIALLRCRDRNIRRQALDILRMQQNDGPWDRFMIAEIGSWIMEIEEEGWDGIGTILEESRVSLSRIKVGIEDRRVMVQCVRRGNPSGASNLEEQNLAWVETVISEW
ncbi:hypothetical protein IFR05_003404 [Cadophora sp. M221]|nr:hypothetical protein IFR05_003404 [Cadophora sp. M221]